ncbi:MAG TPA: 2-(1,2-epoxy-1,2-dihydrophenyl)acetyl-CoA isomerase PaaG [Candidatus Cybelea sp.]|nr:2-(1,2-epoxy-1,2-dihydrophenyl)acetyl-CoA isomerase PaaG [Candidatus Cybelea sp.]
MAYETILLDIKEGVATLTLNRPDRLNAFTDQMHADLRAALDAVQKGGNVRCLLLTGAGRGFCAGADLSAQISPSVGPRDLGAALENHYNPLIRRWRDLPFPTVAAVNGPAAGAGMSIAMACDIVIAAKSATFLQAFCNIGLVPDAGSTWFLTRQIGRQRAAGMALLGERLPAETAAEWGLVWKVVDDAALMSEAAAIAAKLAGGPTKGLALIKKALQASWENTLDRQLDLERDSQRQAGHTEDFAEGVAAFLQKRPAKFRGQ